MIWNTRYENAKRNLLEDGAVREENKILFKKFFDYEEYKLKRQNGLIALDEPCYKTLVGYVYKFRNVNRWFQNKPWKDLTRDDIQRVYDDLEEGRIVGKQGRPIADRTGYYNKVFKSKPFRLADKDALAKEVIEFTVAKQNRSVRFVTEETFRKLTSVLSKPHHLLLFWLAWDIGENIGALLSLTKRNFVRQQNRYTQEPEYLVNLRSEKIKRSRRSRSEPNLYPETVLYADIVLEGKSNDELLFPFGHRQALKIMQSAVRRTKASTMPDSEPVRWKDLRSGMACHLLGLGWTRDEVNARLGHTPSSKALDAYINYLAIDRHRPKQKLHTSNLENVQNQLEESRRREKLTSERLKRQESQIESQRERLMYVETKIEELRQLARSAMSAK